MSAAFQASGLDTSDSTYDVRTLSFMCYMETDQPLSSTADSWVTCRHPKGLDQRASINQGSGGVKQSFDSALGDGWLTHVADTIAPSHVRNHFGRVALQCEWRTEQIWLAPIVTWTI